MTEQPVTALSTEHRAERAMHVAFFRATGDDPGPHETGNATCQQIGRELALLGFEVVPLDREREAVADLRASLAALPVSDEGKRCPNEWACQRRCMCHRLTGEALEADIAAHTRVTHLDRAAVLRLIEGDTDAREG